MSLRVTLCNSITFPFFDEYGKGAARDVESVFPPVNYVAYRRVLS